MKKIEIITHCQSIQRPFYEALLTYQLSSLILHKPKNCEVSITVCCCNEDDRTWKVLDYFFSHGSLNLSAFVMTPEDLGRRAIGRNKSALVSVADIVWFTDVDYVFYDGCLDAVAELHWPDDHVMVYANEIYMHKDHEICMPAIERVKGNPVIIDIEREEFTTRRIEKAIGGLHIVPGDFAREHGYCNGGETPMKPTDGSFNRCECDVYYRAMCRKYGTYGGVDIPNVYRLRHPARRFENRRKKK